MNPRYNVQVMKAHVRMKAGQERNFPSKHPTLPPKLTWQGSRLRGNVGSNPLGEPLRAFLASCPDEECQTAISGIFLLGFEVMP